MIYAISSYMKSFNDETSAQKWLIETCRVLDKEKLLGDSLALNGFGSLDESKLQSLCEDLKIVFEKYGQRFENLCGE